MSIPEALRGRLRLPAIAAPMFLASGPDLVVETCRAGVLGSFPALNARSTAQFEDWLAEIAERLGRHPGAAPFAVNLIVHRSNPRLEADLAVCLKARVPLIITSLGAVPELVAEVHARNGLVFHDVIHARHAAKAAAAGVDGLIAVAAGAGGHAGTLNPFALVSEIRQVFGGTLVLAGAINTGAQVAAAQMMGADMAYLGTRFLATAEARVPEGYKRMIVESASADIVYTPAISGIPANFLRESLRAGGLDPDALPEGRKLDLEGEAKAWRDFWSAGQGVGGIDTVLPAADLCARLAAEYEDALQAAADRRSALRPASSSRNHVP